MTAYAIIPVWAYGRRATSALCDPEDFDLLSQWTWSTSRLHRKTAELGYATATIDGHTVAMHRLVLGLGKGGGGVVHHLNRQKRDNRKANLWLCADSSEHGRVFHGSLEAVA